MEQRGVRVPDLQLDEREEAARLPEPARGLVRVRDSGLPRRSRRQRARHREPLTPQLLGQHLGIRRTDALVPARE